MNNYIRDDKSFELMAFLEDSCRQMLETIQCVEWEYKENSPLHGQPVDKDTMAMGAELMGAFLLGVIEDLVNDLNVDCNCPEPDLLN